MSEPHRYPSVHETGERWEDFRPVIFGEALFDHFPDGSRVLGGAPFNVAWHLRGFKADPLLVTAVGEDREGEEILRRMAAWGLDTSGVQVHPSRPTGRVSAHLVDGQPRFEIEAAQAYDAISQENLPPLEEGHRAALLYHGSLCLREDESARALRALREDVAGATLVDVNLRAPWWEKDDVREQIRGVDWLKLNDEEVGLLAGRSLPDETAMVRSAETLRQELGIGEIVLTRGEKGAVLVTGTGTVRTESNVVHDIVDTVGAGDAFCSVLALGVHHGWPSTVTLERAAEFAGELCRRRGATVDDRDLYDRMEKRWPNAQ